MLPRMFTEADRRLADHAAQHHGVFTLVHARDAGLTHGQIDHRVANAWIAVHEGVYRMPGAASTHRGALLAACWAAPELAAASHRAAAELYDLPGRRAVVEITCRRWERARHAGIVVHESRRIAPGDLVTVDGIPVVRPEVLVLQLAWLWPGGDFVERVLQAARRKRLLTYDSMLVTFRRHARRGLRGVRATRIALDRWRPIDEPTESDMETLLLQALRAHGLPEPVSQFRIADRRGRFVARADLAYPQWNVAIEYDSMQEHSDEFQLTRDARRRNRVQAAGFHVLTARIEDVRDGASELCAALMQLASQKQTTSA
jgi:very-short-patch-repair endonuclease